MTAKEARPDRGPPSHGEGATILDALRAFERDGYAGQFAARPGSGIECMSCHGTFPAARVPMQGTHRVEGSSDPDDMVAIAALECPGCGAHGTVVLKYGPMASPEEVEVLQDLRDERTVHLMGPR